MPKSKRRQNFKKRSIDLFVDVFNHLIDLHREREKFALNWIWNEPIALKVFVEVVLGKSISSRDVLRNGYKDCRREEFDVFPAVIWEKIDEIFLKKRLLSDMPQPVRQLLKVLKSNTQSELQSLVDDNEKKMSSSSTNSHTWIGVSKIAPSILKAMEGCFLGEWSVKAADIFLPHIAKVCRLFPPECVFANTSGNLTHFYERKGNDVEIIAVVLKGALEISAMNYMRSLMEDLFAAHAAIVRHSMATLDSHMTGFGPFWQQFQLEGGSKVSFYTHVEKLGKVLPLPSAKDFEALADRYAHGHLSELILALFMWKLPRLVRSFLKFSKPFLCKEDYDMTNLELALGECGPCAYQLYITKDFCSSIHKDIDISEFTLSYCSHPDAASTTPVQFIMAEHGFRIGVEDGSLFAFKSNVAHGTGYRNHSHNAAYMGCLVVNSALHALTKRRQRL